MRTFEDALNKRMEEPEFRAEYEALEPEFAIIQAMIDARKKLRSHAKTTCRAHRYRTG